MADKKKIKSEASSSSSNSNNGRGESVVVDVGRRRSSCGYCKSSSHSSITHGLWAHSLTVDDYQALLDRGWRRSGCFLYKPEMEKTCCPAYTIRLKASDFVPSKEQVRVSKRMQRFLDGNLNVKKPNGCTETSTSRDSCCLSNSEPTSSVRKDFLADNGIQINNLEQVMRLLSDQIDSVVRECTERGEFPNDIQFPKASVKGVAPAKRKLEAEGSQDLLLSSNISFQISAALRRANKSVHLFNLTGNSTEKGDLFTEPNPKLIAEVLSSHLNDMAAEFGMSVKACNGHINYYSSGIKVQADVITERSAVPKDTSTGSGSKKNCSKSTGNIQAKGLSLEIRLKKSSFDPEEYALYRRYQIKVHNDAPERVTESSYRSFLVDSPLVFVPSSGDSTTPPYGFGSFHQQYLVNGRLVAVGVIDILPRCLSSKYLFWDPDFAFLSLGKYSALQEINWVRQNQGHCPSLQYYYLGYYIHSCNKMRYKAAYRPSELLCPLRYQWVPFDIAKRLLDRKPYVVLSDFATSQNEESSLLNVLEDRMEQQELCEEESNDVCIDNDEEMSELDYEDSDDESEPESPRLTPVEVKKENVSNIVIGLKGMHLRYKDIQQAFGPNERTYLETQLHKYVRAVGTDLSERMIYSLG